MTLPSGTLSGPKDPQPQAWSEGKLVIVATFGAGPNAGSTVACIADRSNFRKIISEVRRGRMKRGWMASLIEAIRHVAMTEHRWGDDDPMQNFMDDLAILLALRIDRAADDEMLHACGLFSITLSINPDTTQPWHKRGFMSAKDAKDAPVMSNIG